MNSVFEELVIADKFGTIKTWEQRLSGMSLGRSK
jgi:hypothetical protein